MTNKLHPRERMEIDYTILDIYLASDSASDQRTIARPVARFVIDPASAAMVRFRRKLRKTHRNGE
jgi:hypothetical protein